MLSGTSRATRRGTNSGVAALRAQAHARSVGGTYTPTGYTMDGNVVVKGHGDDDPLTIASNITAKRIAETCKPGYRPRFLARPPRRRGTARSVGKRARSLRAGRRA